MVCRDKLLGPSDAVFLEDDGTLRLYNLPETNVCKAVRGLGADVSSIAWVPTTVTEIGNVFVAAGQKVWN